MVGVMDYGSAQVNIPAVLVANGVGICLMSAILFSRHKRLRRAFLDGVFYYWMCRMCLVLCLLEMLGFLVDGQVFVGSRLLSLLLNVILFSTGAVLAFLWMCYVDYKIHEDVKRLKKWAHLWSIPAVSVAILSVANLFVDVFFSISLDNRYYRTSLFWLPYVVTFGYLTYGAWRAYRCCRQTEKHLYMPAIFFLLPVYLGSLIQFSCYGISLIWVSVAVGLTFLYINLQNEETFLDSLTGLYNRNYLIHYMMESRRESQITGVLLDINGFKTINDTYGHIEGDRVLQIVGARLLQATGTGAIVVRYGGDEFLVLFENASPQVIPQFRRELMSQPLVCPMPDGELAISLSAGEARLTAGDVTGFFREMDRNMYREKDSYYQRSEAGLKPALRVEEE